jgi:hypothetical protein
MINTWSTLTRILRPMGWDRKSKNKPTYIVFNEDDSGIANQCGTYYGGQKTFHPWCFHTGVYETGNP